MLFRSSLVAGGEAIGHGAVADATSADVNGAGAVGEIGDKNIVIDQNISGAVGRGGELRRRRIWAAEIEGVCVECDQVGVACAGLRSPHVDGAEELNRILGHYFGREYGQRGRNRERQ